MIVYLSGGMRTDWRNEVVRLRPTLGPNVIYLNPEKHGARDPAVYSALDAHAIKTCDVLFAFMEPENPGGIGLAAEIGLAKGLGKTIILVLPPEVLQDRPWFALLAEWADVVEESLDMGVERLWQIVRMHQ